MDGIEPPLEVLETSALPLYYTGINLAPRPGIEPGTDGLTVRRSTAELSGNIFFFMVEDGRIELPLKACKAPVLPLSLIPHFLVVD